MRVGGTKGEVEATVEAKVSDAAYDCQTNCQTWPDYYCLLLDPSTTLPGTGSVR